jgi:hypothetical protein
VVLGSGKGRPSAKQVAIRSLLLREVVAHALATPRHRRDQMRATSSEADWKASVSQAAAMQAARLKALDKWRKQFSPWERHFLATTLDTMSEQQHRDAMWRLEAFQVLAWALGHVPKLPRYDMQADERIIRAWPPAGFARDPGKAARLVPSDTLIHAREVAELWHWRSRTRMLIDRGEAWPRELSRPEEGLISYDAVARMAARAAKERGDLAHIIEDDFLAFGKAYRNLDASEYSIVTSIAKERHFALNWLCGYAPGNRWDETPTET